MAFRPHANKIQGTEETEYEPREGQADSQSNENYQKAPETLRSFSEGTSLHGARFLFVGSVSRKLVWTVALVSCFTYCIYQVSITVNAYGRRPFNTKVLAMAAKRNTNLTFPAVTLCNLNSLNQRRYINFQKRRNLSDEVIANKLAVYGKMLAGSKDVFNNDSKHRHEELFWRFRGNNIPKHTYLDFFSHRMEEMLLPSSLFNSCWIDGAVCGREDFWSFTNSIFGQCHTFNSGRDDRPVKNATMAGHLNGLKLLLNIERDSYLENPVYPFVGLTVLVHDQETFPYMEQFGFLVQPGVRTLCSIKRKKVWKKTAVLHEIIYLINYIGSINLKTIKRCYLVSFRFLCEKIVTFSFCHSTKILIYLANKSYSK